MTKENPYRNELRRFQPYDEEDAAATIINELCRLQRRVVHLRTIVENLDMIADSATHDYRTRLSNAINESTECKSRIWELLTDD